MSTRKRRTGSRTLPASLAPFFQEYEFSHLDPDRDATIIIDRTLEYGNREEIRWLFRRYGIERVRRAVQERGARHLSPRSFTYWRLVLGIDTWRPHPWPQAAHVLWGNRG